MNKEEMMDQMMKNKENWEKFYLLVHQDSNGKWALDDENQQLFPEWTSEAIQREKVHVASDCEGIECDYDPLTKLILVPEPLPQ